MKQWLEQIATKLAKNAQPVPPFDDIEPTVEWQVAGRCNYDCTYCIQSKDKRVGSPQKEIALGIIKTFATLPGVWEIKMSGGEPFAYVGFLKWVIPSLVEQTPHKISVLTNFSAPLRSLEKFCALTAERLLITSASLHLESVSAETFLQKAIAYRELRQEYNPNSSFVVNCVLVPDKIDALFDIKAGVEEAGFRFFPQWMKVGAGVYPYTRRDLTLIRELTSDARSPAEVNRSPNYRGAHCEAGAWYFIVDQYGEAWSCRTAKRYSEPGDKSHLGNLAKGTFQRWKKGGSCPFDICPCTVPANRGVIRHELALAGRKNRAEHGDDF